MTPSETVEWTCKRFEAADCVESLQTCTLGLNEDKIDKQEYTLLPGAMNRMLGVYAKRLAELKGK